MKRGVSVVAKLAICLLAVFLFAGLRPTHDAQAGGTIYAKVGDRITLNANTGGKAVTGGSWTFNSPFTFSIVSGSMSSSYIYVEIVEMPDFSPVICQYTYYYMNYIGGRPVMGTGYDSFTVYITQPVTPTPKPTATPRPTATPTPKPTATPTLTPTLTPAPTATPTPAAKPLAMPKISSVTGSAGKVTIKWGAVSGAEKYRVFYKSADGWKKIADTKSTSYTWTGAKAGKKYTFTVCCVNSAGTAMTSGFDTTGKSITLKLLDTPKISSVTGEAGGVIIKWGAVTGAEKYRVFYKSASGWKRIDDTKSTSYIWTGAKAGKKYTFTVRCVNSAGTAFTSSYDTAGKTYTVPASGQLATPKISSVSGSAGKVTVKWGAVTGAAKYRVFYKGTNGWKKIADTKSTSYTWTGAKAGKKYTFTVRCVNSAGTAFTSSYDTAGKSYTVPSAGQLATPKITSVTSSGTSVTVKWGAVTGAAKYRLFYKKDGKWTKLKDTTATSATITGGTPGKTYTYTVRCINSAGTAYTSAYDKTGKSVTLSKLATPKLATPDADGTSITIKWGAVTGAAKYRVFYKTGSNSWKKIADTTATSYTWTPPQAGMKYTFTVRCVSADGKTFTSDYDKTGKSVTMPLLATPKITSVKASGTSVTVTWGKVSGAAKYRLFYKKDGKWTKLKDTTATSATITGGTPGKTYTYTVRCINSAGTAYTSAYDKTGKSVTLQTATPKITSVKASGTSVTVTWSKVSGSVKYRLFYQKDGKWVKLKDTTATSATITGGTPGKKYTYTVRCVSGNGTAYASAYDKTGKSVTIPLLATPKITSVKASGTSVTVTWGKVSGAAKYRVFYKKDGKWVKLKDTTATSATITGGTPGKTYTYTVRCINSAGTAYTSSYDKTGKSVTLPLLATPKITSVKASGTSVTVTWGKVSGAAKYRVFYKKDGKWTKLKDTTGTSVTITGGTKGKTYTYTVRCIDSAGKVYTSAYDTAGKSITLK